MSTGSNVLMGKRASGFVMSKYHNPTCASWACEQYPGDHLQCLNDELEDDFCTACCVVCYDQLEAAWDAVGGRPPFDISAKQDVPGGDTILTPYGVTVGEIADTTLVVHYTP